MGQKVHPYGFRLGYNKNWQSRWFSKKDYPAFVYEDHEVRKYVKKLLYSAGISKIEIERAGGKIRLILSTARPGIVIGRKGVEIEKLRNDLRAKFGREFSLEVNEIRRPEVDSQLVAENIAQQLERRVAFRRAMKRTVTMARKFGAEGIKVTCSGRLAGAEIARTEWYRDGRVRCRPCVPTSITASPKRVPRTASSASRRGSTKVKSLTKRLKGNARSQKS